VSLVAALELLGLQLVTIYLELFKNTLLPFITVPLYAFDSTSGPQEWSENAKFIHVNGLLQD
jgi:hypothetical protein